MHILFITQYFPPEVGATQTRMHEFARACAAAGHRVTVITEFPNHPHGRIPPEYHGRWTSREPMDGFTVDRVWVFTRPVKGTRTRLGFYLSFLCLSTLRGWFTRGRIDVVFATSPPLPVGLAGWCIARARGARFFLDIRDLWQEAAAALGELRSPLMQRLAANLERFLYRHADRITAVTKGFVSHIAAQIRDPSRVTLLSNGAAVDRFDPAGADPGLRARLGLQGRFVVTFAGLHGIPQGLDAILDAAALLRGDHEVVFCMIGEGPMKPGLETRARAEGLDNVRFFPAVPPAEITPFLTASDALLVPLRRDPVFDTFIPSKLFDFLACARPVILSVDGEARQILEESGGGVFAEPGRPEALRDAVRVLRDRGPEERARMGVSGRAYVLNHFTRAAQNAKLVALLESDRSDG